MPSMTLRQPAVTDAVVETTSDDHGQSPIDSMIDRLDAVIVLAGAIRPGALRKATGRSRLELPVDEQNTVLDCWGQALDRLSDLWPDRRVPVRVIVDQGCRIARGRQTRDRSDLHIEEDPADFRGPGGLLRDIADGYDPDRYILVIRASHLPIDSLTDQVKQLAQCEADLSMLCSHEGAPHGMMLIRCGSLDSISPVGYVDLNEQGLPMIARDHDVRVARYAGRFTEALRTSGGYLSALADYHSHANGTPRSHCAYAEHLEPSFAVVEPGAEVDPTAIIHDSVVLGGGRIAPEAVVVRSVVCPGAVVRRGQRVIDQIVGRKTKLDNHTAGLDSGG